METNNQEVHIIGFDRKKLIGEVYKGKLTDNTRKPHKVAYKILREATRAEWEDEHPGPIINEARVARGRFYQVLILD